MNRTTDRSIVLITKPKKKKCMIFRYFLPAFLFSTVFWWGINLFQQELEDFFIWQLVRNDSQVFLAQAGIEPIAVQYPIRRSAVEDLNPESLSAISVVAVEIQPDGFVKFLFKKNPDEKLPIASITKLMTAKIVLENLDLMQPVKVSWQAVSQNESTGELKPGETLLVNDLLYIALMESSNDAAYALAEQLGIEDFTQQMQAKAEMLGMHDTLFINPTGVDPDPPDKLYNYSTARDLVKLLQNLLFEEPKVWEILNTDKIDLYRPDGTFHHTLVSTNKLTDIPRFIGAKTGWTPLAKECLILVQKIPKGDGFLVYVILSSDDRFGEMKRLVEWVNEAYFW